MVRNRQRKTDRGVKGAQVQEAAHVMIRDGIPLMQAAQQFDVSRTTLRKYVKKWRANINAGNPDPPHFGYTGEKHQVYTDEQEHVFVESLFQAANTCYYFTAIEVRRFAYMCAEANNLKFPPGWSNKGMAGADWFLAFKKRHGGLVELPWGKAKGTSQTNAINWTVPILPCRPTPPEVPAEPKVSLETSQQSPPSGEDQSSEASQSGIPAELNVPYAASQSSTLSEEHQSSESTPSGGHQSSEASQSGDLQQQSMLSLQSTMSGAAQLNMSSELPHNMLSETLEPNAPHPSFPTTQSSFPEVSPSSSPSGASQPRTSSSTFTILKVEDTLFKRSKSRKQSQPKRTTPLPVPQETMPSRHDQHPIVDHPACGKPVLDFVIPPRALQISGILLPTSSDETSAVPVSLQKSSQSQKFPSKREVRRQSVQEIGQILKILNIPDSVVQNFQQMNIDGELFVDLTDEMLDELGVSKLHRLIIHKFRKGWRPRMT